MINCKELSNIQDFNFFDGTFKSIENNIFMRLFNQKNLPLEKSIDLVPHQKKLDLAITYSIEQKIVIDKKTQRNCYMITNEDMISLGISQDKLEKIAYKNMNNKNSVRIETLNDHVVRANIMSPLTKIPSNSTLFIGKDSFKKEKISPLFDGPKFGQIPLFNNLEEKNDVLMISNRSQTFAAVNFTFDEVLNRIYDKFQENFYIIPISVHKALSIREGYATKNGDLSPKEAAEDLLDMVEDVNDILIDDQSEILSYNIYYHSKEDYCTMVIK